MNMKKDTIYDDSPAFKFTEEYIQERLNSFFAMSTQKYNMDNLYVFAWESDKLIETRSGLLYEFEIKVSRSDYKNDFKNKQDKHAILEGKREHLPKYDKILNQNKPIWEKYYRTSSYKKPNYFYYAVPEGLITKDEVPDYAGLVYVLPEGEDKDMNGKWCFDGFYVVKKAPQIHKEKYTSDELNLTDKFYYNMLNWKANAINEKQKRLMTEEAGHDIPYADLRAKYDELKKTNDALKILVGTESQKALLFAETMDSDMRIINAYRRMMKEKDPDFDCIEFENEYLKDE